MNKKAKKMVLAKETIEVLSTPTEQNWVQGGNKPPLSIYVTCFETGC